MKKSLYIRLTMAFLAIVLIPALMYFAVYVNNEQTNTKSDYYSYNEAILSIINSRLEDYTTQLDIFSDFIYYEGISQFEDDTYEEISKRLEFVYSQREEFESILIYNTKDEQFWVCKEYGTSLYYDAADVEERNWYWAITTSDSVYNIESEHTHVNYDSRYGMNKYETVFSFGKKYEIEEGEYIIVLINCKNDMLSAICDDAASNSEEVIQILNKSGEILYSTSADFSIYDRRAIINQIEESDTSVGNFEFVSEKDGITKTVVYVQSTVNENMYYKCLDNSTLFLSMYEGIGTMAIIFIVSIIAIGLIAVTLAKYLSSPLMKLKAGIDEFATGNLDVKLENVSNDEIGEIAESFNTMAVNMQTLIKEKYELELYNRDAQYYSLVAQINPHFLNNVLQSIGAIGLERDVSEVYDATSVLAKMLRYSIKGADVVSMADEVANVYDYMKIQNLRFEDKIECEIQIDEGANGIVMPKLSLQPLIENSFVHGLEKKKNGGKIYLSIKMIGDDCQISVEDDGIGMDSKRLADLVCSIEDPSLQINKNSIGVYNVINRLQMIHGENFSYSIRSWVGKGTKIHITIKGE